MLISRPNARLALLFVATVLLPCTVLVVLAFRGMVQERELAGKRAADARAAQIGEMRRNVESYLNSIASDELRAWRDRHETGRPPEFVHSATRMVVPVAQDRLHLAWENDFRAPNAISSESEAHVKEAESAEFGRGDLDQAVVAWRRALSSARTPRVTAIARLGLARISARRGDTALAAELYHKTLDVPLEAVDDQGIPFALYATLALSRINPDAVRPRLRSLLANTCCLSAEALYMFRDAVAAVAAVDSSADAARPQASAFADLDTMVVARIRDAEQGSALRDQFSHLRLPVWLEGQSAADVQTWSTFGANPWLVSVIAVRSDSFLVALSAKSVADSLTSKAELTKAGAARIVVTGPADTTTQRISPNIAGLAASFKNDHEPLPDSATRTVYLGTLALVLGAALFGAFVLLVDVRRERRLAAMRADFVASVSHELKTPVTAIRLFAETLSEMDADEDVRRRDYLETIVSESERLTRLLNNVLDLSKIERCQKAYRRAPTVLEEVVRRAARTLQYPLAQQGFNLSVETDGAMSVAIADEDAIEQAILNLLANAMKYSGASRDIALRLRQIESDAVIEVQDWGIGIAPEYQPHVTEKFYRVPSPENASIAGTGLGLTLVDHIARAHNGRLEIASRVHQGSTISIRIPVGNSA